MELHMESAEGNSVIVTFINGNGKARETWFSAPPYNIDHVSVKYLQNRLPNVVRREQMEFIKRRFKEEIVRFKV